MSSIAQRKFLSKVARLVGLIDGRPELPLKPLRYGFGWDLIELFMRNRSLDHYDEEEHRVPSKVFKLARDEDMTWCEPENCYSLGVHHGIKVKFFQPTKGFLLGLKKLGFPTPRVRVIS